MQEHVPIPPRYVQVYHSMMEAGRGVVRQHGFEGMYRGLNITLLEIIPYAALQFGLYDTFTAAWSKARRSRISAKVGKGVFQDLGGQVLAAELVIMVQKYSQDCPIKVSLHFAAG